MQVISFLQLSNSKVTVLLSSQSTPGPKVVEPFPFACCNMLWFISASYEKQGMEGWFGVSPQLQGAALKAHEAVWWLTPNECDGQCAPEKQNCFSLAASMTILPIQVQNNCETNLKIAWFLSWHGYIFNFLNTHMKQRIDFIVKNRYFQTSNNFRTFEAERCI